METSQSPALLSVRSCKILGGRKPELHWVGFRGFQMHLLKTNSIWEKLPHLPPYLVVLNWGVQAPYIPYHNFNHMLDSV